MTQSAISCHGCRQFYITHDVHFRYGCRALNFKSQRHPIVVVIESSGQTCQYFQSKAVPVKQP